MIGALLLLAAAAAAWLSVVDRVSPAALALVEWETRLGQPLWLPLAVAGIAALAWRVLRRAAVAPAPVGPVARDAARARAFPQDFGADWAEAVRTRARRLPIEPMGRLRYDDAPGVPFTLVLVGASPEQARRRLSVFAEFLATIPTPPGARVRLESCPDVEGPIHRLLGAEIGRHFAAEDWRVMSLADGADVRFARPDPRWSATPAPR